MGVIKLGSLVVKVGTDRRRAFLSHFHHDFLPLKAVKKLMTQL